MKRSTKIQTLRALVALAMLGVVVSFSRYPGFVVPGLLLLLVLLFVQGKLWKALSVAVVAESRIERK